MLRATLRSVLARKVRLVLTSIAVVLGVGFMAGTLVLTDTATRSFDGLFGEAFAGTAVVVQGESAFTGGPGGPGGGGQEERSPVPEEVLGDVRGVPGVRLVDGDVSGFAQLIDPATGEVIQNGNAPTIGNSWNPAVTPFLVREGSPPTADGEVAIDAGTAREFGLGVGAAVDVVTDTGVETFRVVATLGFGEQDSLLGATLAAFDLETAQRLFDRGGAYDHLYIVGEEGVEAQDLRRAIAQVLPEGYEAVTGADAATQQTEQVEEALGFLRTALLVFAFISVFVGAFIIFNTFNILVTQRTREIGLMRALGASRRQILVSVVIEAAITGLVASALGLAAGVGLAQALRRLFDAIGLELAGTSSVIAGRTVVASLAVGTVVTVAASLSPARRASKIAPVEALREGAAPPAALTRRVIVGAVLAAGGAALLAVDLFGDVADPLPLVGGGAALTFVGAASLSPLVARPLAAVFGRAFRGVVGRLGTENAKRNPRRTASTASALMVGLALVSMVTVLASSLKASASRALDENLRSDFILTTSNFSPMSPRIAETLAADPAIGAVSPFRQNQVRLGGDINFIAGVDPSTIGEVASVPLRDGTLVALGRPDTVLLFSGFADPKGLGVGDELDITFARTGEQAFTIGGIYTDNSLLGDLTISIEDYEENFTEQLDAIVLISGRDDVATADLRAAVEAAAAPFPNVEIRDQTEFKEEQSRQIDSVLGFVIVLLLLSVLIALFGIANTLGLSIYERTRELGLVRAVGMGRRMVGRVVVVEAVIVALIGAVLGLAIGIAFGWALQSALAGLGVTVLEIPVPRLLAYMAIAAVAGVLAAIFPAWKAARLDVLRAISYE